MIRFTYLKIVIWFDLAKYESNNLYISSAVLDLRFKIQWRSESRTQIESCKNVVLEDMQKFGG